MSIGIIGYGSFGNLLADILSEKYEIFVFDKHKEVSDTNVRQVNLEEVVKCDILILAVNLDVLDSICKEIAEIVTANTVVIEVCSTKTKSVEILKTNLESKCQYLATHPLFGPQSIDSGKNRKIVVCDSSLNDKENIYSFLRQGLNLDIIEMSADEHDKQMAWVHALTFFVGRGLKELDLADFELKTDYYQKLLDLVELENQHSIELFNTVQLGNPYSKKIREQFVNKLHEINQRLNGEQNGLK